MIKIKGATPQVIEITHWLYDNHGFDWPHDYMWNINRNEGVITFDCKKSNVGLLILLRFGDKDVIVE